MTSMSQTSPLRAKLQCGACQKGYDMDTRAPMILPCEHTFCQSCLENLPTTCRQPDLAIGVMCPKCSTFVLQKSFIKNRAMLDILNGIGDEDNLHCPQHPEKECSLVCMKCLTGLCLKCVIARAHNGHTLKQIHDAKPELKQTLCEVLKKEHADLEKTLLRMREADDAPTEIAKAEEDVKRICDRVKAISDKWAKEQLALLQPLKEMALAREKAVQEQLEQVTALLENKELNIAVMLDRLKLQRVIDVVVEMKPQPIDINFPKKTQTLLVDILSVVQSENAVSSKLLKSHPKPEKPPTCGVQTESEVPCPSASHNATQPDVKTKPSSQNVTQPEVKTKPPSQNVTQSDVKTKPPSHNATQPDVKSKPSKDGSDSSQTATKGKNRPFKVTKLVHAPDGLICQVYDYIILFDFDSRTCSMCTRDSPKWAGAVKSLKNWKACMLKQFPKGVRMIQKYYESL